MLLIDQLTYYTQKLENQISLYLFIPNGQEER